MTEKQQRFVQTEINIVREKNGSYIVSSFGSRLISVDRQQDKNFHDSPTSIQRILKLSQAV